MCFDLNGNTEIKCLHTCVCMWAHISLRFYRPECLLPMLWFLLTNFFLIKDKDFVLQRILNVHKCMQKMQSFQVLSELKYEEFKMQSGIP